MCLACEQEALWLAYLRRRGLITPDGRFVGESPFAAGSVELPPTEIEKKVGGTGEPVDEDKFACGDPTAG